MKEIDVLDKLVTEFDLIHRLTFPSIFSANYDINVIIFK